MPSTSDRRAPWHRTARLLLAVGSVLVAGSATVVTSGSTAAACAVRLDTPVDAIGCDLVGARVVVDGTPVRVPLPGDTIERSDLTTTGATSLTVRTTRDGTFEATRGDSLIPSPDAGGGGDDGCSDRAWAAYSGRNVPGGTYKWWWKAGSAPTYLDATTVVNTVTTAGNVWERGTANCTGYQTDYVDLAVTYQGRTTHALDIHSDGTCDIFTDDQNTVGFEKLDTSSLARTCTHTSDGRLSDGDITINKKFTFYTPDMACNGRFDLQSVLTHELGHAIGLKDVSQADHFWLTMGGGMDTCRIYKRTLGAGDVLGVRSLY